MDKDQNMKKENGLPTKKKKNKGKHFTYEFNNVSFPNTVNLHRATMTSDTEGVILWLENKKSKQQWQLTITDVTEHGPQGIPVEAVIAFMKSAFEARVDYDEEEEKGDGPRLDLSTAGGEVVITLTLDLYGVWNPEYVFALLPVGLEKVDVLDSQMKDLQEECNQLKVQMAEMAEASASIAFLSISSKTACAQNQIVVWNADAPREIAASHFDLSDDYRSVTIRVAGVYQVQVRLAVTNNTNGAQTLILQLNTVNIAACNQSDGSNYQNTPQLFEMIRLNALDVLQVQCGAKGNSLATPEANRFTITYMGN